MNNFTFRNPTRIVFGRGTELSAGTECAAFGKRILIHYGSDRVKTSGLFDRVKKSLLDAGLTVLELGGAQPNPRLSLVQKGIDICRTEKIDLILAIGGGSIIDSAKAIAVGVPYSGNVWDFYTYKKTPAAALPVATILTIPAAGSEASNSSVITNEDGGLKRGLTTDHMYPVLSILNPELCMSLPAYQIGSGASDIMAHLMERYFTNVHPVELTDRLIEATMRNLITTVTKVLANPGDYDQWAEYMWTGTVAHNNSLDTGRIGDWGSHDIEHELSGIYDITHGAGLAVIFPAWMQHVYRHDIARFARWAVEVWRVDNNYFDQEATARAGIEALKRFSASIGMPTTFGGLGLSADRIEEMAKKCTDNDRHTVGNFVKLTSADIVSIYRNAL